MIHRAARALGVALAGAVNLLDVPVVVLGGILPRLEEPLRAAVHDRLCERHRTAVEVRLSALGPGGPLRAAAASVVRERLRSPNRRGAGSARCRRRACRRR